MAFLRCTTRLIKRGLHAMDGKRKSDMRRTIVFGVVMLFVFAQLSPVVAEDVVLFRGPRGEQIKRTGTIVDLKGNTLTIQWSTGREEPIAMSKVIAYSTPRHTSHVRGIKLLDQGKFDEALMSLRKAVSDETRLWMKREILSQWIRCYVGLNRADLAGDTFLRNLIPNDRDTTFFPTIPLAWGNQLPPASMQQKARSWIVDRDAIAQLLGASWLLGTPDRAQAVATLQRLSNSQDRRVAFLAEGQLWRSRLTEATESELRGWQSRLKQVPRELRGGLHFVIGQALSRAQKSQNAAMHYLRVPILFPRQQVLANQALILAARELEKISQFDEAKSLYQEIIIKAPKSMSAAEAKHRLENLIRMLSQEKK